jgi:hypothetical protein
MPGKGVFRTGSILDLLPITVTRLLGSGTCEPGHVMTNISSPLIAAIFKTKDYKCLSSLNLPARPTLVFSALKTLNFTQSQIAGVSRDAGRRS